MDRIRQLGAISDLLYENRNIKGLMFGDLGVSLVCHSLFQITGKEYLEKRCIEIANRYLPSDIKDTDFATFFPTSFACGFTGIYSALKILANEGVDDENLKLLDLEVFDEYICENILELDIESDWSVFHGATGQLYYLTFCRELNDAMKLSTLCHVSSLFEGEEAIAKFRSENGNLNVSLTHGVTGFLLVILTCYRSVNTGMDRVRKVLLNGIEIFEKHIQVRLNTVDLNCLEHTAIKKDLMVCVSLINLGVDCGASSQSIAVALMYSEILLETLSKSPLENIELGQHNGLSGVVECIRSLYKYSKNRKFLAWFDYYYDVLCRRFSEIDREKHINNGTLFNGSCGSLLTILHPKIGQDPAWRKLFLY